MNEYRYILEPYKGMSTRYHCPSCNNRVKTFSFYIDKETGLHIAPNVGRCNRESNCGHHYTPKQYFTDYNISFDATQPKQYNKTKPIELAKQVSYITMDVFKASLKGYETNHFVTFLIGFFGEDVACSLISKYYIGTSKHWYGSTVFWQIDIEGKIRTGHIMLYNPNNGKRVKEPKDMQTWVHKAIKQQDYNLKQCLFGEHLLKGNNKPVAVVESEKTAIIASIYLPQFIWVATCGIGNLNDERCNVLKGRNVVLFPDMKAFDKWSEKARELSNITNFKVSDLIERKASEIDKHKGYDIADVLMGFDYKDFIKPKEKELERIEIEPPFNYLEYFQQRAKADYNKYFYGKRTVESFNNYLLSWYNDMKKMLFEHSISKEEFFKGY